jgi:hypothetical protein
MNYLISESVDKSIQLSGLIDESFVLDVVTGILSCY